MDKEQKEQQGISVFSRNENLLKDDPLEEIFALNLGDFLSEHLISDDLAKKIGHHDVDKVQSLKNQLKELIAIYSIDNTLKILGFNNKEDYIIYNAIAKTIKQMLEMDACHIFLSKENAMGLDDTKNDLLLVGSSLKFDDDIYSHNIGYVLDDGSIVSQSFNNRESLLVEHCSKVEKFKPISQLNEENVEYYLSVPMNNNMETVGVIVVENYSDKYLTPEIIELLTSTARLFTTSMLLEKTTEDTSQLINSDDVSIPVLQNNRAELTALIGDLGDEQQAFVENLAKAVDTKSNFTNHHSHDVAELAREISSYINLNEKTKDLVYYAALLRNIGKITLPEELFNKKEKLSQEDWNKLQNHPNIGVSILMSINFMAEVIPYINYHKERWDGQGEPEGLKGQSIPLGSRIVAIADAYCALTSDRGYKKAVSNAEALNILKDESGIKWDPELINALTEIKK